MREIIQHVVPAARTHVNLTALFLWYIFGWPAAFGSCVDDHLAWVGALDTRSGIWKLVKIRWPIIPQI